MRKLRPAAFLSASVAAFLLAPASPAGAAAAHVVMPGETLWSIAAANNLTTRTVAAYNGLSETSQVVLGSTIQVPTTVKRWGSRYVSPGDVNEDPLDPNTSRNSGYALWSFDAVEVDAPADPDAGSA